MLVEQARSGSHAAFRTLVERHQKRVYGMALSMLRDPDDARDVVQDAFIKAYRNLAGFQGDSAFYTWLYRIAMNLCIDRTRRRKRAAPVEFDETVAAEEDGESGLSPQRLGFDPARALDDREIRERVMASLEKLSPAHRAIIIMREVDGLSYQEIADTLSISIGTVMSRLFYARKRLQEMLRDLVDDDGEVPSEGESTAAAGTSEAPASPTSQKANRAKAPTS